ncbi:MAG: hypothetical protein AAGI17_09945 [Planctomycetota bacterium]
MSDEGSQPAATPAEAPEHKKSRWRGIIGFVIGFLLFSAAIVAVAQGGDDLKSAWESIKQAPLWLGALVLLLPVLNWLTVSLSFWVITARYGRVGPVEMCGLIGTAWLLNYLPMKPGMVGRFAYHKKVNGIRYKDSARVIAWTASFTAICTALLLAVGVFARGTSFAYALLLAPLIPFGLLIPAAIARGGHWWRYATALNLRYLDMLIWTARYWATFKLVGVDLEPASAALLAVISQAAIAIPIAGNGLGAREWAVGVAANQIGFSAAEIGLAADVINRGAELIVSLPLGILGWLYIARRTKNAVAAPIQPAPSSSPPPESTDLPVGDART